MNIKVNILKKYQFKQIKSFYLFYHYLNAINNLQIISKLSHFKQLPKL